MSQCLAFGSTLPAGYGGTFKPDERDFRLSRHATVRAQQRALPLELLEIVLTYGSRSPAGGGAEIVRLTLGAICELAAELNPAIWRRHFDRLASVYLIIGSDGTLVTVGHRIRRIGRR